MIKQINNFFFQIDMQLKNPIFTCYFSWKLKMSSDIIFQCDSLMQ